MNESFEANPTEALGTRPRLSVADTLYDADDPDTEGDAVETPRREGLPPSFRMRHDTHYVDELMSARTIAHTAAHATTPRPADPAAAPPPIDDAPSAVLPGPSAVAVELLASRLEALAAHDAVAQGAGASRDLVSRTLQAELQRVSRFARAVAICSRPIDPVRRTATAGEIAAGIRTACSRIVRLHGMDCLVTVDDANFAIAVERPLVVQGIAGTVDALLDLIQTLGSEDSGDGDRITISLQGASVRPALIVDLECARLHWRGSSADGFFDNREDDFFRAPAAGVLLESAAHVVRLHGGRVEAHLHGGTKLRYVFPQDAPLPTAEA